MHFHEIDQEDSELESRYPLFLQVQTGIERLIKDRKLKAEDKIPNEEELCALFKVSRTTVRKAVSELVKRGTLYRQHPKGTFVAKPKIELTFLGDIRSLAQEMNDRGLRLQDKILIARVFPASQEVSDNLRVETGSLVFNSLRLRTIENELISIVDSYVNRMLCPGIESKELQTRSLYDILQEEYDLTVHKVRRILEPITANEKDADLLETSPGVPMLLLRSVSYLQDGTPLEYYEAKVRGDRSTLAFEITRKGIS